MSEEKILDSIDKFEKAIKGRENGRYVLKLYVSGITPNSIKAIKNIETICRDHLKGRVELEIIDIYKEPERAREAQIIAVPTLIKNFPQPLRRLIGNLSDDEKILVGLGLVTMKN
jgi:circadian clock protein KaiB